MSLEPKARETMDQLLRQAGWEVCDKEHVNIAAHRGVAIHEVSVRVRLRTCGMIEDRWLSVDEIAAYLRVKRDTVYRWIRKKYACAQDRPLVEISEGRDRRVDAKWR